MLLDDDVEQRDGNKAVSMGSMPSGWCSVSEGKAVKLKSIYPVDISSVDLELGGEER